MSILSRTQCPLYNTFIASLSGILNSDYTFDTTKNFIEQLLNQIDTESNEITSYRNTTSNTSQVLSDLKTYDSAIGQNHPDVQGATPDQVSTLIVTDKVPIDVTNMSAALYEVAILNLKLQQRFQLLAQNKLTLERFISQIDFMKTRYQS